MTDRQQRFVEEYLIDLNATQAAIRAGFSAKTAEQLGYQLLQKPSVAEAVAAAKAERSRRVGLTADRVLEELAAIGFARLGDYVRWDGERVILEESGSVDTRAVAEVGSQVSKYGVNLKIKMHDKVSTLKLLGQHIGMFADRLEHSGKIDHTVTTISEIRQAIGVE